MDAAEAIKEENTMRINTNLTALNTYNQVTKNQNKISNAVAQLSSGSAINSAADNAAGLAISEKMRAQIRGLDKASSNAQDAISLVQTAEGALSSSTKILQRMRELAVQASSDTNEDGIDRAALQDEFSQLQQELNEISTSTAFNKKNLLDGSLSTSKTAVASTGTTLKGSSMSVSVGNAQAGQYEFDVSVVTTKAAVEGHKADTLAVTDSSVNSNYFTGAAVAGGATPVISDAESSLLNGSYTIAVGEVNTTDKTFTLTATKADGTTFTSKAISMDANYSGANNSVTVDFGSDAFSLKFDLSSTYSKDFTATGTPMSTESMNSFASAFTGTTFTVSGGVDAQDAKKEVQASLTGASNVTLKAGDKSATFDNGVTVYFEELTADSIDTIAQASKFTVTAGTTNDVAGLATTFANAGLGSTEAIAQGAYTLTATATFKMAAGADATSSTIFTTAAVAGTAQFKVASGAVSQGKLTFDEENNRFCTNIGGKDFYLAANDAQLSTDPAADGAQGLTFKATDGSTLTTSLYATAAGGTLGSQLTTLVDNNGGTRYFSGTATTTANGDGYQISATNGTDTYTSQTNTTVAAGGTGTTVSYTFKDADGNNAFNLNTVNGSTTAVAVGNVLTGLSAIKFSVADDDFKYEDTFGSSASTIQVNKSSNAGLTFQVGANEGDELVINVDRMDSEFLGVNGSDISTQKGASKALSAVDKAINQVSSQRAALGAIQNRLEYKIENLSTSSENLTSAESQIRDVDMAKKMTEFTNANILSQASTAMLAQANSLPQSVLSLIGG